MLRTVVCTLHRIPLSARLVVTGFLMVVGCSSNSSSAGPDAAATGGVTTGTGGSLVGSGGVPGGTGGTPASTGGSTTVGAGGATTGTGGLSTSTGGTRAGTGGTLTSTGGTVSATGGAGTATGGTTTTGAGGTTTTATGGRSGGGGATATGGRTGAGGATSRGGATSTGGQTSPIDGGQTSPIDGGGNQAIPTHCTSALPAGAQPVDVTMPASIVGTGTPESCTFAALNAAVKQAGIIVFNCGSAPVTIAVTSTLVLSIKTNTVIDGGGTVTLDGQKTVQIFNYTDPDWMKSEVRVTLQHLTITGGKTTPTEVIPTAPAPCSQGYNDGEGGALYMRNGNLTILDCTFTDNQAAPRGPDTGGGAIYITGSKYGALIVGSVFTGNQASNAGAIGGLFATLQIYDSMFRNNKATGDGANSNDPSKCDAINNGQNEIGSGGNGGAIYQDGGSSTNVLLCGVDVENNAAGTGAYGGGVFMTSNDFSGTITVQDSTVTGNTGGSWTQVNSGPNLGSAFGVNAKSSTVVNSTLQK
jgi:hypothetical protein